MKSKRYGISDIIVSGAVELQKYVDVHDKSGNVVGSAEVFFIEDEDSENKKSSPSEYPPKTPFEEKILLLLVMKGYPRERIEFKGDQKFLFRNRYVKYNHWEVISDDAITYVSEHSDSNLVAVDWEDDDCGLQTGYEIKQRMECSDCTDLIRSLPTQQQRNPLYDIMEEDVCSECGDVPVEEEGDICGVCGVEEDFGWMGKE